VARAATVDVPVGDDHADVIRWYRDRLSEPAVLPWAGGEWTPVTVGPTWQTDGDRWVLPDATLGWDVLGWCGTELQYAEGEPWRFTLEQARFILWWYAVDETGTFLFRDGVLQRLKGWGKDPVGGCLLYVEAIGPCRVAGMDGDTPVATDCPSAWVQTAATSLEQTKNTMRLMPGLITPDAKAHYGVQTGKELIHAADGERLIQAVTSSPATLEGARATFVLMNETQHWDSSNGGHEMAAVIERNAAKSADGAARTLAITNAPVPGMDSVAERSWDAYALSRAGGSLTTGIMYDSLEADPAAPLSAEAAPDVVRSVRGDSVWLDVDRIVASILDTRNPAPRSRRFWYNQRVAAEDAWLDPNAVDRAAYPDRDLVGDIVLFFDGSKSDDATGLVACRMDDGHVVTVGVWARPAGVAGDGWVVNRYDVDQRVREVLDNHNVVAFFADPSHAVDDVGESFWDSMIDGWHRDYQDKFKVWAVRGGERKHSVMWDMTSHERQALFTEAAMRFVAELEHGDLSTDDHPVLNLHLKNARRLPNRWGVSLWKGHREGRNKIDLAVCAVGARMLRRLVLNTAKQERQRTGKASFL
jgi:hypothetical protein